MYIRQHHGLHTHVHELSNYVKQLKGGASITGKARNQKQRVITEESAPIIAAALLEVVTWRLRCVYWLPPR